MAGLNHKLEGSTIIEVVVAMVIILTCMTLALSAYSKMSFEVGDEVRIMAELRLNAVADETVKKMDFTDTHLEWESLSVKRTILPYPKKNNLRILLLEAYTPLGKKISEYRQIVVLEPVANAK